MLFDHDMGDPKDNAVEPELLPTVLDDLEMLDLLPMIDTELRDAEIHNSAVGLGTVAAAAVVLGGLAVLASGSKEQTAALQPVSSEHGLQRYRPKALRKQYAERELPDWFLDLDRMGENTVIRDRKLSDKNWADRPTESDAIILFGHVIRRKLAAETAMLLGSGALLRHVLRKRSFDKIDSSFLGDVIMPIKECDISDTTRLAAVLTDGLGGLSLWNEDALGRQQKRLASAVMSIKTRRQEMLDESRERLRFTQSMLETPSRRRRPSDLHSVYEREERELKVETGKLSRIIEQADEIIDTLNAGRCLPAVDFVALHGSRK